MTNEIRQCIDMINHGEVPRGYKKAKSKILPSDWKYVRLGTILEKVGRRVVVIPDELYTQIGIRSHGKGLFYKEPVSGKALGNKAVFWIEKDCFIVNIVFAWEQAIGRTTDNEVGMIGSHRFPMYRPNKNQVSVDYLIYYFNTKEGKDVLENASPGGAGRNRTLGQKEFLDSRILCPSFLEQEKIAEILTTCHRIIELKEKLIAEKQAQKKWIMQNLLTGKKRLKGFAGEWKKVKLSDFCEIVMGQSPLSTAYNENNEGLPLIQGNADLNIQSRKTSPRMFTKAITKTCEIGDIIMSVRAPVGTVAKADIKACIGRGVCRIRTKFSNEYVFQLMLYQEDKWVSLSQGSTFDCINGDEVKKLIINKPPLVEQTAIASILSTADREIELLQSDLNEWKNENKALIQLLLTGKMRVI